MKRIFYPFFTILLLANSSNVLFAQADDNHYCHFITAADEEIDFSATEDDRYLIKASQITKEILDASGNVAYWDLRANRSIPNATAVILKKKRFIQYNPDFIAKAQSRSGKDWVIYSVFAHEIGHHTNFHLTGRNDRHIEELEADQFSGFILFQLGASLKQAQSGVNKLSESLGSRTHPPKRKRLAAIEKGWNKAKKQANGGNNGGNDDRFHRIVDEADKAFDNGDYASAQRKYERAQSMKSGDTYVEKQLKRVNELLTSYIPGGNTKGNTDEPYIEPQQKKEQESRPPPPAAKKRGRVTVVYRGDNFGCSLNVRIRIGDRYFDPTGNTFTVEDIELGWTNYEITGDVGCTLSGFCTIANASNSIQVVPNATLYVMWQNTAYATCSAWLSYE